MEINYFTTQMLLTKHTKLFLYHYESYAYLQWSQGAGKTVSGTAQGMYRLAHGQTDYVFVVSSAISIEITWAPFLAKYQIPHKVIRSPRDLRRVYPGDFVLITLGRVKNYQRQIQKIVKLAGRVHQYRQRGLLLHRRTALER